MKIKKWLIWQKMLYNRGGAWIPDALLSAVFALLFLRSEFIFIPILILCRWLVGKIDYALGIIQLESEIALRRQNPYLDRQLKKNGNRRNGKKARA